MEHIISSAANVLHAAITIVIWEWFGKDFITWDGFGTPFKRKNRKPPSDQKKGKICTKLIYQQ